MALETHRIETARFDESAGAWGPWKATRVGLVEPDRRVGALSGALLRLADTVQAERRMSVRTVPVLPAHAAHGAHGSLAMGYGSQHGHEAWRVVPLR